MEILGKYQSAVKKCLLIIVIFAVIYLSITYLFPFFAPFVIAVIVSFINEPVIKLLGKIKVPRKIAAVISLLFTLSVLGSVITFGIIKIYNELISLQENLSHYSNEISTHINNWIYKLTNFYNALPAEATETITNNLTSLSVKLTGIISAIFQYAINTASSIPTLTVFVIVTILATYFISSDRRKISLFLFHQLPLSVRKKMSGLKKDTIKALLGYFKAMLILMAFTFIEMSIGLFILNVNYAFLLALIVGIAEAIPVVGTGLILIPWIVWHVINGNMTLVIGLSILYVLGILIRQIMEPKIVGAQIGLHPLVTLLAMYVGLKFFGVLGMFIGPISIIIVKNLQDSGFFRLWND